VQESNRANPPFPAARSSYTPLFQRLGMILEEDNAEDFQNSRPARSKRRIVETQGSATK
jgi:hypothetical protein